MKENTIHDYLNWCRKNYLTKSKLFTIKKKKSQQARKRKELPSFS